MAEHTAIFITSVNQYAGCYIGSVIIPYLSHWNDGVALAPVLAGETQIVLRQTDLAKCVKMAEGHPEEALVHL